MTSQPEVRVWPHVRRTARHWLKRAYFEAIVLARMDRLLCWVRSRDGVALILNFHRVSPQPNPYSSPITPEAFAALLDYLSARCQIVTLDELTVPRPSGTPQVVLSFDDGCRDFVEYAMPILDRRRLRTNHNVIVGSVESGEAPWVIRVLDGLNAATTTRVFKLHVPGFDFRLEGEDDLAKARYGTKLTAYLKGVPLTQRKALCEDVERLLDETDPSAWTAMMSRADVQGMAAIHEVGSHSYSHESMARLTDEQFAEDFDRCEAFFADIQQPINVFAFPNGSFRGEQVRLVQARGVKHVLLVGERPATVGSGVYSRITMYGDSSAELRMRALGHRFRGR